MKKEIVRFPRSGKLRQIGRMMKLMVLFMILGCVRVSARSVAQNQRVSLNLRNCTVMKKEEIQQQTSFVFLFTIRSIFRDKNVLTVRADDEEVG